MQKSIIDEAIANMASTSALLDKYCNDPAHYNMHGSVFLEQMSWELIKKAKALREMQNIYGF